MTLFSRTENGKLFVSTLDLQIFFGELFTLAKDESEVDFILENIQGVVELVSEERMEKL